MVERLGEMRKGRRERIEKGSRERIEKERDKRELRRQFEKEEEHHHLPLLVVRLPQGLMKQKLQNRATLSHQSFCQHWGYLISRRSLSLQLEVN